MTGKKVGLLAALLMGSALAMPANAQDATPATQPTAQPGQNGQNGANGGRRNFDPTQFRQAMMNRIKEQLGASDDEFAAIQPKLQKVMDLQRDANGGGRGMFGGGRGGANGGGRRNRDGANGGATADAAGTAAPAAATEQSAVQKASADLRTTLDNKDSTPADIKAKLDVLRAAKSQAKDDLAAAQKDLQGILTQRQEAVLVQMGMLN